MIAVIEQVPGGKDPKTQAPKDPKPADAPKMKCYYCTQPAEMACGFIVSKLHNCERPLCAWHAFAWQGVWYCHRHIIELAQHYGKHPELKHPKTK